MNVRDRKRELLKRIVEIERFFSHIKVSESHDFHGLFELLNENRLNEVQVIVDTYPTSESLLAQLIEKLKGKSIYRTLKKITEGKTENDATTLKGLFSLGTHVAVEMEKENKEYAVLLHMIHERIGKIIYG